MKKVLLILTVLFLNSITFAQWDLVNSYPLANSVRKTFFINSSTGWLIGDTGPIMKTTDGGISWETQYSYSKEYLSGIHFADADNGIVVGMNGTILKTTNGGKTWNSIQSGFSRVNFYNVYMINVNTGFIAAGDMVLKTNDGGITWNRKQAPAESAFVDIKFSKAFFGIAVGGAGKIMLSSDGGETWVNSSSGTDRTLYCISFVDENCAVVGGQAGIYLRTTNLGASWTIPLNAFPYPFSGFERFSSMDFTDNKTGIMSDSFYNGRYESSVIFKTTDGGLSWQSKSVNDYLINCVTFTDKNTILAGGEYGNILKSTNCGESWSNINKKVTKLSLYDVCFADEKTAFSIGNGTISERRSVLVKSIDGGENWSSVYFPNSLFLPLFSMHFCDNNHGVIVADLSFIFLTNDGGITWEMKQIDGGYPLSRVFLQDTMNITVAGKRIYHSSDGGKNWQIQQGEISTYCSDIFFWDCNNGIAIGNDGAVLRTSDGGAHWNSTQLTNNIALNKMHFYDKKNGLLVGNGVIFLTTDGGKEWIKQNSPTLENIVSVYHKDEDNWVILTYNSVFTTSDGGVNWSGNNVYGGIGMAFANKDLGVIVGSNGLIMRTTSGGLTFVNDNNEQGIPEKFGLKQNYPNPFNPNTTINYTVNKPCHVKLKVYDLLGKQICTLVDEEKAAGEFSVRFDAKGLSSGVYFYTIRAGGNYQAKKMVLTK